MLVSISPTPYNRRQYYPHRRKKKATRPAKPAVAPLASLTAEPSNSRIAVGLISIVTLPLPPLPSIGLKLDGESAIPAEGVNEELTGFSIGMSSSGAGTPISPAEVEFEVAELSVPPLGAVADAGVGISLFDPTIEAEGRTSLPGKLLVIAVTPVPTGIGRPPTTGLEAELIGAVVSLLRLDWVDWRFVDWPGMPGAASVIGVDVLADDKRPPSVGNDAVVDAALLEPNIPAEVCDGAKPKDSVLKSDAPGYGMETSLNPGAYTEVLKDSLDDCAAAETEGVPLVTVSLPDEPAGSVMTVTPPLGRVRAAMAWLV